MNTNIGNSEFLKQPINKVIQEESTDYGKYSNNNNNCVKFGPWKGALYTQTNLNDDNCYIWFLKMDMVYQSVISIKAIN